MKRVAAAALLSVGLTLTACGHQTGSAAKPRVVAPCFPGGPVGPVDPPDLSVQPNAEGGIPACAVARGRVWTTQCFPQQGAPQQGWVFEFMPSDSWNDLVGRTGGRWVTADPNESIYDLGVGLGCVL